MKEKQICVALAGISGAIGSTLATAIAAAKSEPCIINNLSFGMVTESPVLEVPRNTFINVADIEVTGWDIQQSNLYQRAELLGICPPSIIQAASPILKLQEPRRTFSKETYIKKWIAQEAEHLRKFLEQSEARCGIIVNLLPTEVTLSVDDKDENISWKELDHITLGTRGVTPSRVFFRLAIEAGFHFINFTPNYAEHPQLCQLASERGILYCGRDGKTGQTFLKSLIAPAFHQKNFFINGWFSLNLLGNDDGRALNEPERRKTKVASKSRCLESILGYSPGNIDLEDDNSAYGHQVHIYYYPPRGDAKEAWDNIDFMGFLKESMQMKINWLGKDSILAAPAILDIVRIVDAIATDATGGVIESLAYFFKDPISEENSSVNHDIASQYQNLKASIKRIVGFQSSGLYRNILLHLNKYHKETDMCVNLHASETRLSPLAAIAQAHDLANRYSLSDDFITDIAFGNTRSIQPIVDYCNQLLKDSLYSSYVSLSPLSGLNAADIAISAFGSPGDTIFLVSEKNGGHPSLPTLARSRRMNVKYIPYTAYNQQINWEEFKKLLKETPPILIYFDVSDQLFEPDMHLDLVLSSSPRRPKMIYDVSHFLGLVVGGYRRNPLDFGFDAILGSTHKSFPGPHKGIFSTNDRAIYERFETVASSMVSSKHTHHILSLAIALAEFQAYGKSFIGQLVSNANSLGSELSKYGLNAIHREGRYTDTHQLWIPFETLQTASEAYRSLEANRIFVNLRRLPFDLGWGLRLGLQGPTLEGLDEDSMKILGNAIASSCNGQSIEGLIKKMYSGKIPFSVQETQDSLQLKELLLKAIFYRGNR